MKLIFAYNADAGIVAGLKALPHETAFYHRADFRAAYPGADVTLPAILIDQGAALVPLLDADEIASAKTVDGLIAALEAKLT